MTTIFPIVALPKPVRPGSGLSVANSVKDSGDVDLAHADPFDELL